MYGPTVVRASVRNRTGADLWLMHLLLTPLMSLLLMRLPAAIASAASNASAATASAASNASAAAAADAPSARCSTDCGDVVETVPAHHTCKTYKLHNIIHKSYVLNKLCKCNYFASLKVNRA